MSDQFFTARQVLSDLEDRAEHCRTSVHGCELSWRLWGNGPPLVLLHGNFGNWAHWVRNISELAKSYRVIVPDLPGFGESDIPPEGINAEGLGRLMAESYAALGQSGCPIISGFSLGSTIAGAMAETMVENVAQLIIVSAGQVGARRQTIPRFTSWRKATTETDRLTAHATNLGILMLSSPESIDELAVYIQARNAPRARLDTRPITAPHPLREILFRLSCPISGIWGADDATIGPYMHDRHELMAELGAGNYMRVVDKAGHWVQYERPDIFNSNFQSLIAQPR